MSAEAKIIMWAHLAGDSLIALSCFVIAFAFSHFAFRNRGSRLSLLSGVFSALFTVGGLMHACEVAGWSLAGAVFKILTALFCAASALLSIKCLPNARMMFARIGVIERRISERMKQLNSDPRYDTREDREWTRTLAEIRDMARMAKLTRERGAEEV